ncbi:hypothetical protein CXF80_16890 [Shewanella sp. Actino-trap-3]|uniref:hypothetical protein n=1 Tax=Shewanella sp. Actino-trap-3 TaxID=2058331 RepID=UPI000C348976|nr:hypothetical protein [Shewanella sp. Actino-trap-3]PKG79848.1 hypothetical protein CXF80_16890 [Shewanella sp. Actino-trap-3]
MKQRPIIFNIKMVRAILDGRKTQTRRPFPQWQIPFKHSDGSFGAVGQRDPRFGFGFVEDTESKVMECFTANLCPMAKVGDQLWVRETMTMEKWPDLHYVCGGLSVGTGDEDFSYRSEDYRGFIPSIHMPKWASRILLEVTDIRVEKMNSLRKNKTNVLAEGFENFPQFKHVWQTIYGECKPDEWVWVIEFKVLSTNCGAA